MGLEPSMPSLSGRVISSGMWVVALSVTAHGLGVIRLLILARLLTPRDFGVVATAVVVISLFEAFSTTGTSLALIRRRPGPPRQLFDTAWTLGLIRGGVVAVLLVIFAPAVARFFDSPEAVAVVRVMALVPLMSGLINVGVVEFRKELTFGPHYLLHTSGAVADLCVAVPLALWHANAWALVGGWLAMTAVLVIGSYGLHPYRPSPRLDAKEAAELLGYARWILGSAAISWFLTNGVQAVVGRLAGVQALGLYQMASRIAYLPTTPVTAVVAGVTVAGYAELQERTARVRQAYLKVLTVVVVTTVPLAVGLALYGADLVRIVLGSRWVGVVAVVQVLAFAGLCKSITATAAPVFQALNRPRNQTIAGLLELGVLAGLLVPFMLRMGPVGAAAAAAVGAVGGSAASLFIVSRFLEIPARRLVPILGSPFVACLPFVVARYWFAAPIAAPVGLGGALLLSGILYVATLVLLDRLHLCNLDPVLRSRGRDWSFPPIW
jgi:lipopolysaccharide exporter